MDIITGNIELIGVVLAAVLTTAYGFVKTNANVGKARKLVAIALEAIEDDKISKGEVQQFIDELKR